MIDSLTIRELQFWLMGIMAGTALVYAYWLRREIERNKALEALIEKRR